MSTIAVAGASTGFGRILILTLLHLNKLHNQPYTFIVLSRSESPELTDQGATVRPVDYANHSQLVSSLSDVHTVLSVIGGSPGAIGDAQLALIAASVEAGVKRFAPSEYAGRSNAEVALYAGKDIVLDKLKDSGLEYTRFQCGLFMSVMATGTVNPPTDVGKREGAKTGEEEALAGLRPWNFVINMKAGTADLPGDGNAKLTLTDTRDVAHFVFRALELERWPAVLGMRGDVKSFNEIVAICEGVQERKWLTRTNTVEEMRELSKVAGKEFYNEVRLGIADGWALVGDELNTAFPEVKPVTCEEFAEKWWRGVKVGEASWVEDVSFMRITRSRRVYYNLYRQYLDLVGEGDLVSTFETFNQTAGVLFQAVKHWNHWLRAVIYDDVLSGLSLGLWILVTRPDPRTMLKCSLFPWFDEVQAVASRTARRVSDATEEMYEELQLSQPPAKATDAWSCAKDEAGKRTTPSFYIFGSSTEDEKTYGRPTKGARSRSARRASVGAGRSQSHSRALVSPVKRNASSSRRRSEVRSSSVSRPVPGFLDDEGEKILSSSTWDEVSVRAEASGPAIALCACGGLGVASAAVFGAAD